MYMTVQIWVHISEFRTYELHHLFEMDNTDVRDWRMILYISKRLRVEYYYLYHLKDNLFCRYHV